MNKEDKQKEQDMPIWWLLLETAGLYIGFIILLRVIGSMM